MLVGVGKEDFSKMVELDSDDALLSEDGVYAERDIVQFVEFEKYKNNGEALAKELLAEFPGQFLTYMKSDIPPSSTRFYIPLLDRTRNILPCESNGQAKEEEVKREEDLPPETVLVTEDLQTE